MKIIISVILTQVTSRNTKMTDYDETFEDDPKNHDAQRIKF